MIPELERIKTDVQTIHKAMGLVPAAGLDWVRWMKRDNWLNLWWCLPGAILIASAGLPSGNAAKYFGLAAGQWAGLLTAATLLGTALFCLRKLTAHDGRPEGLIREYRRVNGLNAQGAWFSLALVLELALYLVWSREFQIGFGALWSGLWILMGSTCLVAAVAARTWLLLGWAIPFLGYGAFLTLLRDHGRPSGLPLGIMFIAVALCFSFMQLREVRKIERLNESH